METCAIVAAEIFYGARTLEAERLARSILMPFPIHPFTVEMAARQSLVVRTLADKNQMQDLRDVMIAVSALELQLPVATLNEAHFRSIPGLVLEELEAQ